MIKVYLTDDDKDDRLFFEEALNALEIKCECTLFKNGKELYEDLINEDRPIPDLIFLDLNMPVMGGFDCLKKIRKIHDMNQVVVAIYSTSSSQEDVDKTFLLGANIYIKKPETFRDLKMVLNKVLKLNWQYLNSNLNKENFLLKL